MRWGRSCDGRRHLVQTRTEYLGIPGVTLVAMCGVVLERLAEPSTAWHDSSPLACARCTTTQAAGNPDPPGER